MQKPRQGFWGLWNISFGYFGIQMAFALQNANISRIFQSLGSSVDNLAILWIAGPVTGLLVQPLIGHFSDQTWGRLGRRRPYFLAGAVLATLAMVLMPNAGFLVAAALLLWLLDASLNISMEPFRAFVGDMVPSDQRATGFAFQTAFIGIGAVIGSLAPIIMTKLGIANTAAAGIVPPSVRYGFYVGAASIVCAVLWTVLRTREYSPEEMRDFESDAVSLKGDQHTVPDKGWLWLSVGIAMLFIIKSFHLDKQLYILGAGLAVFGVLQLFNQFAGSSGALGSILSDLAQMPDPMKRLALAQFFTWIALFIMWIYTTPIVTQYIYHSANTTSASYNNGADWVDVLFSVYNGVAALAAFCLPFLTRRLGAPKAHMLCLFIGAVSYASIFVIRDKWLLVLPMIGIGITWASILTMPYVILTDVLPQNKLGVYIGIFNFFIVLPQLLVATIMGGLMRSFFPGQPIWTMLVAALVMALAALAMLRIQDEKFQ